MIAKTKKELPLSVVISALIVDNSLLLIKRIKGDYIGYWGLPGGKVEKDEHLSDAAVREIYEESGIESEFSEHLGFVSEHLIENGIILKHFLLHICELVPKTTEIREGIEGNLKWFNMNHLEEMKENIIPSDYLMIENMIKDRKSNYYNCVLEKIGDKHVLRRFESQK